MSEKNNFGWALERLFEGKRVQRTGWNGKGMWIALVRFWTPKHGRNPHVSDERQREIEGVIGPQNPEGIYRLGDLGLGEEAFSPFIGMKTADDKFVPWLASQTDVLARDWQLFEGG